MLGGVWLVIRGVRSTLSQVLLLIAPLRTTKKPASRGGAQVLLADSRVAVHRVTGAANTGVFVALPLEMHWLLHVRQGHGQGDGLHCLF